MTSVGCYLIIREFFSFQFFLYVNIGGFVYLKIIYGLVPLTERALSYIYILIFCESQVQTEGSIMEENIREITGNAKY